jgi:flavin-dependent dehydrogenase
MTTKPIRNTAGDPDSPIDRDVVVVCGGVAGLSAAVCASHGAEIGAISLEDDDRPFSHDWVVPEEYFTTRGRDLPPGCEEIDEDERNRRESHSLEVVRDRFAEPHPDDKETHPSLTE